MTGVVNYEAFAGKDGIAPVAIAVEAMGTVGPDGMITPAYPWLNNAILLAILGGYASVILVMLMGQSRVFFSMSKDGLMPKVFSEIHEKFRTPAKNNLLFMVIVSLFAAFVPARVVGEMTSIGTLFAFILVCIGVLIMRKKMPDAPRAFRTPLVPFVPIAGVLVCLFMMVFLPLDTWIRLIVWMMIGFDLYLFYGMKHSILNKGEFSLKSYKTVAGSGLGMVLALIVIAFVHHSDPNVEDTFLFYFSLMFAALHALIYAYSFKKVR
jgi:APA family basic amino acid/polyamine antiporter